MNMIKKQLILDAIQDLKEGKPLGSSTKRKLVQIGVNLEQFIKEFARETKTR